MNGGVRAGIAVVGFGYGAGTQLTARAQGVLRSTRYAGHLGLDAAATAALRALGVSSVDLEGLLLGVPSSGGPPVPLPADFPHRVARVLVCAAAEVGHASLVVAGHPMFHNRIMPSLRAAVRAVGFSLEVVDGVSAFDNLASALGLDFGWSGVQILDARTIVSLHLQPEPRVPLLVYCASYLYDEHADVAARATCLARLAEALLARHPSHALVQHVRFGDAPGGPVRGEVRLAELPCLAPALDPASTLYIPALCVPGPCLAT